MNRGFTFTLTLLLVPILLLPFVAHSSIEENDPLSFSETILSDSFLTKISQTHAFFESFIVESTDKNLTIELFSITGKPIASTLYKHHNSGVIKYETGKELARGIYLVKLITGDSSRCFKMAKIN